MGITNFHKMIKEHYPEAFKKKWINYYDNVYVDLNFVLHYCSFSSSSEEEVFSKVYTFFDNILVELSPTKSLTICSDGVAPLAKLILQRQRRLNVSKNLSENNNNNNFTTMMFTPGTNFMKELKFKLSNYFDYISNVYGIQINYLDDRIDEAELKLKNKLMENMNQDKSATHVIVTNDADVVVMLTTLKEIKNSFVFTRSNNQNDVLSIGKLIDLHTNKFGMSLNSNYDFALISIMMGNDYIPKIRLVDFDKLWNAYKSIIASNLVGLVNYDFTINYNFFVKLLNKIIELSKQKSTNYITIHNCFNSMYSNYLDGLTWCLETYQKGVCSRYDYMYEHQESPHPLGLIINILNNKKLLEVNKSKYDSISPELYAILVLPTTAKNLIDNKYHKFMNESDILYTNEKCQICKELLKEIKESKLDLTKTEAEYDSDNSDESESEDILKKIKQIKLKNTSLSKKLTSHKKNHDQLSLNDIKNIIDNFNNYCKLL